MTNDTRQKLKPCPFCGAGKGDVMVDMFMDDTWSVSCGNCGCDIGSHKTEQWAREAWNKRSGYEAVVKQRDELLEVLDHIACHDGHCGYVAKQAIANVTKEMEK